MRLTESQARRVAYAISHEMGYAGSELVTVLSRDLTEDESSELLETISRSLVEVLGEFEFLDPVEVPKIDPVEAWAQEHEGHSFRRPKGKVLYTVTGKVELFRHGFVVRNVPVVRRSSDGAEHPMRKSDLLEMIELIELPTAESA